MGAATIFGKGLAGLHYFVHNKHMSLIKIKHFGLTLFCCALFLGTAWTETSVAAFYKYSQLRMLNLEDMRGKVQQHIAKARQLSRTEGAAGEQEAVEELREALKLILSRPDNDNMLEKLMPLVRKQLENYNAFYDSLSGLVAQASFSVKQGSEDVAYRASNLFVLENTLSHFHPELKDNKEVKKIYEQIAKANIKVPKKVVKHRRNSMFKSSSPSKTAKKVLKKLKK